MFYLFLIIFLYVKYCMGMIIVCCCGVMDGDCVCDDVL